MRLGFYNFYTQLNQNKMFQNATGRVADGSIIGDDLVYPTVFMARYLKQLGHDVATIDTAPLESFDAVVFLDYPISIRRSIADFVFNPPFKLDFETIVKSRKPLYLVLFESSVAKPDNWNRAKHKPFKKVFTWSSEWVDGKKYIQFHMPHKLPEFSPYAPSTAEKFCCLVASQKYSLDPNELYSERIRAIRWFEKHHPDEFDLYGQRWDRFFFKGNLSRLNLGLALLYSKFPQFPRQKRFPSWRGNISSKHDVMKQYRFSICYENAAYPGWITEKILDAMFAGSVPIYEGDPEITKIIPAEAFIDKRKFPNYDSLYRYLKGMSESEYEGYRQAIHKFVHGDAIKPLGAQAFADLFVREVINDR